MKTFISDSFPLYKLECQYFEICQHYTPKLCKYSSPCYIRQKLKEYLEEYVANNNLEFQVKLIILEGGKK